MKMLFIDWRVFFSDRTKMFWKRWTSSFACLNIELNKRYRPIYRPAYIFFPMVTVIVFCYFSSESKLIKR